MSAQLKTIEVVFDKPNHKDVKFSDGTSAIAKSGSTVCFAPLETGEEQSALIESRMAGGRPYDLLVQWGMPESKPEDKPNLSIAAQAPIESKKKPEPKAKPIVQFDNRELSIMTQVALKEACASGNARGAMSKYGFEPTGVTVTRMKAYLKGMVDAVSVEVARR